MKISRFNIIRYSVLFVIILCIFGIYQLKQVNKIHEQTTELPLYPQTINLEELKSYNKPVFINFGLTTCHACRETRKSFETVGKEYEDRFIYQFAEMDKHPNIAADFAIISVPTQVIYNADGTPYFSSENTNIKLLPRYALSDGALRYTYHEGPLSEEDIKSILKDMGVE